MVDPVKAIGTELHSGTFGYSEVLEQGKVPVLEARGIAPVAIELRGECPSSWASGQGLSTGGCGSSGKPIILCRVASRKLPVVSDGARNVPDLRRIETRS